MLRQGPHVALHRSFVERFGRAPERVGHAPGRVNVIGEHTDHNGGLCLPFALPQRTRAAVARRDDATVRVHSAQTGETVAWPLRDAAHCAGWAAYVVGTIAALDPRHGFDVLVDSEVPVGAGLSSSAALTCAVALAVAPTRPPGELLAATMRAENEFVGAPTGGLDQTIALHARAGAALLLDFGASPADRLVRQVPSAVPGHEWWVLDSHVSHELADGGYARRRAECAAAAAALAVDNLSRATLDDVARLTDPVLAARARHVVTENARVRQVVTALEDADASAVGAALTASHLSLRDDFEVSCGELDELVAILLEQGARGARMIGGGFGGSALTLLPEATVEVALSAVLGGFRRRGWRLPTPLAAGIGAGGAGVDPV
ncbi:galactokinase [Nocardioides alcanivorans]|uniref:galactokinase n=1 Tax=Nocardioides alcanivorans TaxID=2897352 RepID=UPI001F3296A5|nr:galactokinase family protein [Nocardioides alcanivorans]